MKIKDKIGQPIEINDTIAYGHALGRCAGLRIGKVLKIKTIEKGEHSRTKEMLYEYRITVIGIDDDWSHREPELNSRKGTLQFPDRIIVLNPSVVPENYKVLLENYGG